MKYRVALYRRKRSKQALYDILHYSNIVLSQQDGFLFSLQRDQVCNGEVCVRVRLNTTDKRRKWFYAPELYVCDDIGGEAIYCNDLAYDSHGKMLGVIRYDSKHAAFLFCSDVASGYVNSALISDCKLTRLWHVDYKY